MTQKRRQDDVVRLSDPRAIRALAHPARLAVIEELYSGGLDLTATECAELAGLSPSAMSYHLRALERAGIVQRAPSTGDGRERPWRAAGRSLQVDSQRTSAAADAASDALGSTVLAQLMTQYGEYHARRAEESPAWREAAGVSTGHLWLLPEEVQRIQREIFDAMEPYRGRSAGSRPDGARRVRLGLLVFPVDRPR